jgi:NAD(P)-dependent dehydrogenase (short-subunit alcohol dehydrogenase family)
VFLCSKLAIPAMRERGRGAIVNISSIAASVSIGGAAYAAAKGGIVSYTRHAAPELAPLGIRMNCVAPGFMRTPMATGERHGLTPEEQEVRLAGMGKLVPMGHTGSTMDIAEAVLFLASDEAGYITGQELVVDGGYLVR